MLELRLVQTMIPKATSESHPSAQEAASMEGKPIGSTHSAIVLCPKETANAVIPRQGWCSLRVAFLTIAENCLTGFSSIWLVGTSK